jgi:hypothetical protein
MPKKKKKTGPVDGPKPKKKKKGIADLLKKKAQQMPSTTPFKKPKPKLEKEKLLPERKVPPGEKPNMLDVAGGAKTVNVKGGGLMEATKRLKAQGLKKGGFPDLSGDGKITMKDILMGRGVVKKPKKKAKGGSVASTFKLARAAKPSGRLTVDDIKRATTGKPSMTLQKGRLKGAKDAPEERRREAGFRLNKERRGRGFQSKANFLGKGAAAGVAGGIKAGARAMKKAGRLALRGYGKARK